MSADRLEAFRRELEEAHRHAVMAPDMESMLRASRLANKLARIVVRAKRKGAA